MARLEGVYVGIRDYIAFAADQYGTDRGVLDNIARLESTYNPSVQNNWDSNAKAGTPSYGLMQFIQPTFNSFAAQAAKANPNAWKKFGSNLNWKDPRQQALAASWAISNGKGSHWATYERAKAAAPEYGYKPKYTTQPGSAVAGAAPTPAAAPMFTPQQIAAAKRDYDAAIGLARNDQRQALTQRARFDTADTATLDKTTHTFDQLRGMSASDRVNLMSQPTQARAEFEGLKDQAEIDTVTAKAKVTKLQADRENIVDRLAKANLPPANSELGGGGNQDLRSKLVQTAKAEIGTVASQAMKYIRAAGGTGYEPWCGGFVQYVFKQNGLKPPPARSVPALLSWSQENNTFRKQGRAGDLVMFDWNNDGTPDHVELVTGGTGNGGYSTIGGNTSGPQGGSQVAQKNRASNILGFVDALSLRGGAR